MSKSGSLAIASPPLVTKAVTPPCLCIDIETPPRMSNNKFGRAVIHKLAAFRPDSGDRLCVPGAAPALTTELDALTEGAGFVLGHNIRRHDLPLPPDGGTETAGGLHDADDRYPWSGDGPHRISARAASNSLRTGSWFLMAVALSASPTTLWAQALQSAPRDPIELPTIEVFAEDVTLEPILSSTSLTVLDRQAIETSEERDLNGIIRGLPSVTLRKAGSGTTLSTLQVRGHSSGQGLIILDGIPLYSTVTTGFNLSNIPADAIQRVEVVRGPIATRYGSHALGGTIRLFARDIPKSQAALHLEGGSFGTLSETLNGSLVGELGRVTATASRDDVFEGTSQANPERGNTERDRYQATQGLIKAVLFPNQRFDIDSTLFYSRSRAEFDGLKQISEDISVLADDLGLFREETWMAQSTAKLDMSAAWTSRLQLGFTQSHPKGLFVNPLAPPPFSFTNELLLARWTNQHSIFGQIENAADEQHVAIPQVNFHWGLETRNESGKHFHGVRTNIPSRGTLAGFAELQAEAGGSSSALGMRTDYYDDFGAHTTFYLNGSAAATQNLRLRASIGSGYRAPSFQELYFNPFVANPRLQPERALGGDFGLDWNLGPGTRVSAGGFYQRVDNLILLSVIGGNTVFSVDNVDDAEILGVEVEASTGWTPTLTTGIDYTYTETEDLTLNRDLPGQPKHQTRFHSEWRLTQVPITLWAEALYRSEHFGDPANRSRREDALIVNAQISYTMSPQVSLYVRGENLSDNDTEESLGFGVRGVGVFGGMRLRF